MCDSTNFCWPVSSWQSQAAPKRVLTNDCRFQCIVSLLEHASALFFINLLLLSAHVRLRNAGAGNRNCDTSISTLTLFRGSLWGKSFPSLGVFNLLTNSVPEHFIEDTLNLQWPKRIHQRSNLCCQMQTPLCSASWLWVTHTMLQVFQELSRKVTSTTLSSTNGDFHRCGKNAKSLGLGHPSASHLRQSRQETVPPTSTTAG